MLLSDAPLEDHITHGQFRLELVDEDQREKSSALIRYYIVQRMIDLDMSVADLVSTNNSLTYREAHRVVSGKGSASYTSLSLIATSLNTTADKLVANLERDLLRFDTLDLDISPPQHSPNEVNSISQTIADKMSNVNRNINIALDFLAPTGTEISRITNGWRLSRHLINRRQSIRTINFIRIAWITGIHPRQMLSQDSIYDLASNKPPYNPTYTRPLTDRAVQRIMDTVVYNIQIEMERKLGHPLPAAIVQRIYNEWSSPHNPLSGLLELAEELDTTADRFFVGIFTPQRLLIQRQERNDLKTTMAANWPLKLISLLY